MTGAPQTGYAQTSDGSYVAFETRGVGPLDLLEVSNGTLFSYTSAVEQPAWMDYVERLASFSRLIRYDPRGIGLSDPLPGGASTAESYADEIMAVLDGAGSESAALVGATYAGAGAILRGDPPRTGGRPRVDQRVRAVGSQHRLPDRGPHPTARHAARRDAAGNRPSE